jgi:hypothetical protein
MELQAAPLSDRLQRLNRQVPQVERRVKTTNQEVKVYNVEVVAAIIRNRPRDCESQAWHRISWSGPLALRWTAISWKPFRGSEAPTGSGPADWGVEAGEVHQDETGTDT